MSGHWSECKTSRCQPDGHPVDEVAHRRCLIWMSPNVPVPRVVPTGLNALDVGAGSPSLVPAEQVPQADQAGLRPQRFNEGWLEGTVSERGIGLPQ